jgi:hypothetical protein
MQLGARSTAACLSQEWCRLCPHLYERTRRTAVAAEAVRIGRGAVSQVSRARGPYRVTITKDIPELDDTPLV